MPPVALASKPGLLVDVVRVLVGVLFDDELDEDPETVIVPLYGLLLSGEEFLGICATFNMLRITAVRNIILVMKATNDVTRKCSWTAAGAQEMKMRVTLGKTYFKTFCMVFWVGVSGAA